MKPSVSYYRSDDEMRALVESFESCSLPPDDFDHRAHLTVAIWYLSSMTVEQATERMRECLLRFIAHNGVDAQKYNETITQFWIKRLDKLMREADPALPLAEMADQTIEKAGGPQAVFDYYTRERVFSEEARGGWVEPDKQL
jgi:hypothetical protein